MIPKTETKVDAERIPAELRERGQWIGWRWSDGNKIPVNAATLINAKSNTPATWTTFDKAFEAFRKNKNTLAGIGFVISAEDPFCGIDLDSCREPSTGLISEWAQKIIDDVGSYCEISPSGTGVKIICRAKKTAGSRCEYRVDESPTGPKATQVEIYDKTRFWTMTGDVLPGLESIRDAQSELESLVSQLHSVGKPKANPVQHEHGHTNGEASTLLARAENYIRKAANVGEGQRNTTAFRLAGNLAALDDNGQRLPESEILSLMSRWNSANAPPLPEHEIKTAVHSGCNNGTARPTKSGKERKPKSARVRMSESESGDNRFDLQYDSGRTDSANARRFIDRYHKELLYVAAWKKWLSWDGRRWIDDNGSGVLQRGVDYADSLWNEMTRLSQLSTERGELDVFKNFIKRTNSTDAIKAFIALAAADTRVVCKVENLNSNPYLLNVHNGTVDLRTSELRAHDPADRITQLADVDYDPTAECPNWKAALELWFAGNQELIIFIQHAVGYSVSGLSIEHLLLICWGMGCNGKSVFWNTIAKLLGDYATLASQDLLLPMKSQHPTDRASLYQKRFVAISEPSQGRSLDEAKTKELTGGDVINARRMGEDFWTFTPTHTLWMASNHKPKICGVDEGIWRRLRLVPFAVDLRTVTTVRPGFADWLVENEGAGILAWIVRGFRGWQNYGLGEAAAVTSATADYRQAEDEIGGFIAEHCDVGEGLEVRAGNIFAAYLQASGDKKMSQRVFGESLANRFHKDRPTTGPNRKRTVYHGLALRSEIDP